MRNNVPVAGLIRKERCLTNCEPPTSASRHGAALACNIHFRIPPSITSPHRKHLGINTPASTDASAEPKENHATQTNCKKEVITTLRGIRRPDAHPVTIPHSPRGSRRGYPLGPPRHATLQPHEAQPNQPASSQKRRTSGKQAARKTPPFDAERSALPARRRR